MIHTVDLPREGFRADMPEIYQIEVSSVCNLRCTMCPRTIFPRADQCAFIDLALIDKLVAEDAFRGSYFVEFQMAGEPTLNPDLPKIIEKLRPTGVLLGLSTNGTALSDDLLALDYVTISVDSITEDSPRQGRDVRAFIDGVREFIAAAVENGEPVIDLQIIELDGWEHAKAEVEDVFQEELASPICSLRTVNDCFLTKFDEPDTLPVSREVCLNPWLSVSIQANGNVTSCCFSFGDDIVLGNIREQRLEDIWRGPAVEALRAEHREQRYRPLCARCYMRSPVLLHWNIFTKRLKQEGGC